MDSQIWKRSVAIDGRKTSVSLEDQFWTALKEIAAREGTTATELIARVNRERGNGNLSSAVRLFILRAFKQQFTEPNTAKKKKVLLVDDDPLVLSATAGVLEDLGFDVGTAPGGTEAVRKLMSDTGISLLITDINMPELSGYELAERARRLRPDLQVILLSGQESESRGFPLIRKPLHQTELTRVMRETAGST